MEKKTKKFTIALIIIGFMLVNTFVVIAQTTSSTNWYSSSSSSYRSVTTQYYEPSLTGMYSSADISTYWPILTGKDELQCYGRQDFIVQIPPAGCEPAVVRSDLLEEQNVPVFCKLDAVKLNPLIDVKSIDRIVPSIAGKYPSEIAGLGYYPARAALRSYDNLLGSPLLNNIGYVVVVLKRNPVEKNMSDYVTANLTAVLKYDMENAWGVGRGEYYLPILTDDEWSQRYQEFEFWRGKGFLRLESLQGDKALISVYSDKERKVASRTLTIGSLSTSDDIYLPGFYCQAAMKLQLNSLESPEDSAILQVNDDKIEVRKGAKFGKSCYVASMNIYGGGTGTIDIVCGSERKVLSLEYADVNLQVDKGEPKNYAVGSLVTSVTRNVKNDKSVDVPVTKNLFLAYVGILPSSISSDKKQFVALVETSVSNFGYNNTKESIRKAIDEKVKSFSPGSGKTTDVLFKDFKEYLNKLGIVGYDTVTVIVEGGAVESVDDRTIVFGGSTASDLEYKNLGTSDSKLAGEKIDSYSGKATSSYEEISTKFPSEKVVNLESSNEFYGERALWQAANLARLLDKKKSEQKLWLEFIAKYPTSALRYGTDGADDRLNKLASLKSSSSDFGFANGDYVRLVSFKQVSIGDASVSVRYTKPGTGESEAKILMKGDYIVKREANTKSGKDAREYYKDYISLKEIKEDYAVIDYDCVQQVSKTESGKVTTSFEPQKNTKNINLNENQDICGYNIFVDKINLRKVAKVSIIPNIKNTESMVNFTVKIGIEKRAIELSTDKTKEMIKNLNDSIKRWEDINKKLGNVVEGLKGACFATSAILQAKTLFEGLGGKATARTSVMQGENGWTSKCTSDVAAGKYTSVDDCLHQNSAEIEKSVSYLADKINNQNTNIQAFESGITKTDTLGLSNSVDTAASRKKYIESMQNIQVPMDLKDSSGGNVINGQEVWNKAKSNPDYLNSLSYDDLKNINLYSGIANDASAPEQLRNLSRSNLYSTMTKVNNNIKAVDPTGLSAKLGITVDNYNDKPSKVYRNAKASELKVSLTDDKGTAVPKDTAVQAFTYNNKEYIATLEYLGSGQYKATNFYTLDSGGTTATLVPKPTIPIAVGARATPVAGTYEDLNSKFSSFAKVDAASYRGNKWKNLRVRYWETAPYKGVPSLVPVEPENGWYAATKQTLPSLGNVKTTEASGRVTSFWLCNVGANGIDEFDSGMGDDICEQINLNTGQATNLFPGLATTEASRLISKAQKAIMEASEKYAAGVKRVSIMGTMYDVAVPTSGKLGTQCQDFMSPDDCYLLFNVCDPVICPTSRCNLGGTYYVPDVVQSGIIGSVALCLPNIKEGIFIPVCLTGVHAGIESYLSILRAHRDCLAESLKSGQHVGICDEIYSIYLCEFFWRQLAPIMNLIVPKMIELAYGQGTRGGGEYLTVMDAWNNMEKSVDYFTSSYAANAAKSFQIRNTEEVGTTVCKAFVSTKYPSNLKLLLEPESPSQFYSWFSEIPFTDATVPATSQYKVFYHIYAGEDQGVYYSVYLQNPPGTSLYQTIGTVSVATGYIAKGGYADETKDFTAPKGYQELCVRINEQEKCGFKQVSSDFAVNYIKDSYVAEQASSGVTSEKECVSGTPSLYGLLQPNLQEGVTQAAMPSLYSQGITRVCSTDDPGKTTEPGRWKDVGYCDTQKVRCWIDTKDVANNILAKDIKNKTLAEIEAMNQNSSLAKGSDYVSTLEVTANAIAQQRANLSSFSQKFDSLKLASTSVTSLLSQMDAYLTQAQTELDIAAEKAIFNKDKVQLMLIKAELFENATRILYWKYKTDYDAARKIVGASSTPVSNELVTIAGEKTTLIFDEEGRCKVNLKAGPYGIIKINGNWILQYWGTWGSETTKRWGSVEDKIASGNWMDGLKSDLLNYCLATSDVTIPVTTTTTPATPATTPSTSGTSEPTQTWQQKVMAEYLPGELDTEKVISVKNSWLSGDPVIYKFISGAWTPKDKLNGFGFVDGIIKLVEDTSGLGGYVQIKGEERIGNSLFSSNEKMARAVLDGLKTDVITTPATTTTTTPSVTSPTTTSPTT